MGWGGVQNLLQMLMGEEFCGNNHSTVRSVLQWERTTQAYSAHGYSQFQGRYIKMKFKKKERKKTLKRAVQKARREQAN